jgi:tRNA-dihydrouridine synthase
LRELALLTADIGESCACKEMRKRFCAYTKSVPGGAVLRKIIVTAETIDDYKKIFAQF